MNDTKEMTAPVASVGADVGQSIPVTEISIAAFRPDCKDNLRKRQAAWQR